MNRYATVSWGNSRWNHYEDTARTEERQLARLLEQDRLDFEARLHEDFEPTEMVAIEGGSRHFETGTRRLRCPCGALVLDERSFFLHLHSAGCDGVRR